MTRDPWTDDTAFLEAVDDFCTQAGPAADALAHEAARVFGHNMPDLMGSLMCYLAYVNMYTHAKGTPYEKINIAFQEVITLPFVQQVASKAVGEKV